MTIKIITWNLGGVNSPFRVGARELIRIHNLDIFIVVKPRITSKNMGRVINTLGR